MSVEDFLKETEAMGEYIMKIKDINSKDWNTRHRAINEICEELDEYKKDTLGDDCLELVEKFAAALQVDCIIK